MLLGYGHIVDFFTAFDWWDCQPLPECVEGAASCLGKPGRLYVVYFREGGRATVRLTEDTYRGKWYNPRSGKWQGAPSLSGPVCTTPATPDENDWVLWLENAPDARDTTAPGVISVVPGGNGRTLLVDFDELPSESSATNPSRYAIQPDVAIEEISMAGPHGKTAILSVTPLQQERSYTLTVEGVRDRAGNRMKPSHHAFQFISADRPLIELTFDEAEGRTAKNTGTARQTIQQANLTKERPTRSTNTPPAAGSHSLDFGGKPGPYAIDLPDHAADVLDRLASFTITAWVNCTSDAVGAGGNRIVHMADTLGSQAGLDLVFVSDGSLKLGINQWPDQTEAVSSPGLIPVDRSASADNWRFIAVTYDSQAKRDQVRFYIGSPDRPASLDRAVSYNRGPLRPGAGTLTVGHFNPSTRANHTDRMFRGLIDEVRIFAGKTDGAAALSLEEIRAVQAKRN